MGVAVALVCSPLLLGKLHGLAYLGVVACWPCLPSLVCWWLIGLMLPYPNLAIPVIVTTASGSIRLYYTPTCIFCP